MTEVRVIDYQEGWPAQYAQVASEIRLAIAAPGIALEHIGSTAVVGLCAKPVLDIALGVDALEQVESGIAALARIGFVYRPEYERQIPERRYFVRAAAQGPRVHLHALILGGRPWRQHLRFRDALREYPALARSYAALKRQLALLHADDKGAYTEAKAPFIAQVLAGRSGEGLGGELRD